MERLAISSNLCRYSVVQRVGGAKHNAARRGTKVEGDVELFRHSIENPVDRIDRSPGAGIDGVLET
jgi:hypothetical protein